MARQHFKGSCSALLGHPGAVPNHSNAPETWVSIPSRTHVHHQSAAFVPSSPQNPDRGERGVWGGWERGRWARRRGCTALGGPGLGEKGSEHRSSQRWPGQGLSTRLWPPDPCLWACWCCSPGVESAPCADVPGQNPIRQEPMARLEPQSRPCRMPRAPVVLLASPRWLGWAPQRPLHPRCGHFGQEGCTEAVSAGLEMSFLC